MAPPRPADKPPSPLMTRLRALDAHIAEEYSIDTLDDPRFKIDVQGAIRILKIALNGDAITPNELDAILLLSKSGAFTKEAQEFLKNAFVQSAVLAALVSDKGSGKVLGPSKELDFVNNAISLAAAKVDFISPGTGIHYNADKYEAMKILLSRGEIRVISVRDKGVISSHGARAAYANDQNVLYIFESVRTNQDDIAHEITHAIQDFLDIKGLTKNTELDGMIAQALCQNALGTYASGDLKSTVMDMAIKHDTSPSNLKWITEYNTMASTVGANYARAGMGISPIVDDTRGEGSLKMRDIPKTEKMKLTEILKSLEQGRNAGAELMRLTHPLPHSPPNQTQGDSNVTPTSQKPW